MRFIRPNRKYIQNYMEAIKENVIFDQIHKDF